MDFFKSMAGKVVAGLVALVVIVGGISWWQMDPATRESVLAGAGRIFGWLGVVALLPWATFFLIGRVARRESNLAGGLLVAAYTLLEGLGLLWLFDWSIQGTAAWSFVVFGVLLAGVYNLFVCDWIAEKLE
jgi:FtsH-binding integral membrane protein